VSELRILLGGAGIFPPSGDMMTSTVVIVVIADYAAEIGSERLGDNNCQTN
jgi:hypothetical protein